MAGAQSIGQAGSGNVAVNVDGDNNTVTISRLGVELTLFQRHKRLKRPKKDLDLLNPEARSAIPRVGRDEELRELTAWLNGPKPIAVGCLFGRAGSGKTRLGIELCEQAEDTGWTAGFVSFDEIARFARQQNLARWRWRGPTLVVIDYAAAGSRPLRTWLEELAQIDAPPSRLRLLLLERHADEQLGWWAELTRFGGFAADVEDLLDPPTPKELPSLASVEHRWRLLKAVMAKGSRLKGITTPLQPPAPGADSIFDRELANDRLNNEPLYLLMAGLAAVQHGVPHLLTMRRLELALSLAEAEIERIVRLAKAQGLDPDLTAHMAALVTLLDGADMDQVTAIVRQEQEALGFPVGVQPGRIGRALSDALAGPTAGLVDAIRPDLIGEAAVLLTFHHWARGTEVQAGIVERAWRLAPEKTIASTIRTAQDFAEPETTGMQPRSAERLRAIGPYSLLWLDRLIDAAPDAGALFDLAHAMPESTVALRERAAAVQDRIVEALRSLAEGPEEARSFLAGQVSELAIRLSALGRREEALAAAQEAVDIRRELAAARPDAFQPDLAMSLNNLAIRLSALGRREEALAAAQEAADLYRELAAARPDAFRPDLAMSLSVLAARLEAAGNLPDAVRNDREAVATLVPAFDLYPAALASPMLTYLQDYLRRAEAGGLELNHELLAPIIGRLSALMGDDAGQEAEE